MKKIPVKISGMNDVVRFVDIVNEFDCECDLCCGSYVVDAKSILGVVTLLGALNLELIIHSDKTDEVLNIIKPYSY